MPHDIQELETVHEQTTPTISGVLRQGGEGSAVLPGSTLTTLTARIYHLPASGVPTDIVAEHSILNVNNGAVDEAGNFSHIVSLTGTTIQNDALKVERHYILYTWTWGSSPVRQGRLLVALPVKNLATVS